jgi:hypothetical protein
VAAAALALPAAAAKTDWLAESPPGALGPLAAAGREPLEDPCCKRKNLI